MSADTTPLLISTPSKRYAGIEQAVENLSQPESVFHYLDSMREFDYEKDAQECLDLLVRNCEYVEYDQMNIKLQYDKEVYKWINLGKAVSDVVDSTFQDDAMKAINTDVHKHSDGIVTINYDYYSDEWTILHNGYIRGEVMCTETDLTQASHNYCANIKKANYNELKDIEMNEKIPKDWHIVIDEDSYELYYKGYIAVLGGIREGWEDDIMEYIEEESEIRNSCN